MAPSGASIVISRECIMSSRKGSEESCESAGEADTFADSNIGLWVK